MGKCEPKITASIEKTSSVATNTVKSLSLAATTEKSKGVATTSEKSFGAIDPAEIIVNSPLQRPMGSSDFLGQREWSPTPQETPITDVWQLLDEGVFTPNINDSMAAGLINTYILINLYRDTIPNDFFEAVELKINLYFSGFNLGNNPVVMFWLYTDYPTFLVRQLGAPKKVSLLFAGQTAGGLTMPFYNDPRPGRPDSTPSEDELKKITLLLQSTTGAGGSHDPPYDPP